MNIYLNNLIKKLIVFIVVLTMTACNTSFAADKYFEIKNLSGKSINISLSNVEINGDTVILSTKYIKNYDKNIIIKFAINVNDKTLKKLKQDIFDKKGNLLNSTDYSNKNNFKPIKDGSLMADLYDIAVTLKLSSESFSQNPKVWHKYFKKVATNINKQYHPNILRWKQGIKTEDKNVSIIVLVDKSGKILSYDYENISPVEYKHFDRKYKEHVEKIFLNNKNVFPPLPKEYSGEKIIMRFKISYSENGIPAYKNYYNEQGTENFDFSKKSMPLCYLPLWTISLTKCVGALGITFATIPLRFVAPNATENFVFTIYDNL